MLSHAGVVGAAGVSAGGAVDPTRRNGATGESAVATTTATFGFTATAGRLLVLHVASDDYMASPPSGWTRPTGAVQESFLGHYLCYKIAAGGETSVQYTIGSASVSCWAVEEYDHIGAFDIAGGSAPASGADTFTSASVTATTGRRFAIAALGCSSQFRDITGVSGWTNSYTETVDVRTTNGSGTQDALGVATLAFDGNGSTSTSTAGTWAHTGGAAPDRNTSIVAIFTVV